MANEITESKALPELASRLKVNPATLDKTLRATAFKECKTNEQFISAVIVANTYGLNPILKEMYAFPSRGGAVIPIVSIDGWISLVNRQKDFDGCDLIENEDPKAAVAGLKSVTATFYLKNKSHPIVVTEYMDECYNGNKEPWKKWPRRMLRHKAYIQGARIAFGFSGIYDPDEGDRIKEATDVEEYTMKPDVASPNVEPPMEAEYHEEPPPQEAPPQEEPKPERTGRVITEKQRKRLYAISNSTGYSQDDVKAYLAQYHQIDSTTDILMDDYEEICNHFEIQRGA